MLFCSIAPWVCNNGSQSVGACFLCTVGCVFGNDFKTEKKAQERTYELLKENQMATDEEIVSLHKLFRLYNIQYINNIIISVLELIYYALRIFAMFSNNSSSSSSNN